MRITLHDNIHPSAGEPHPESRRPVTDTDRAPWVKALHEWLGRAAPSRVARTGELGVDGATVRMRVTRHGDAIAAVWTAGRDWGVVAASLVLPGKVPADDDEAIGALRDHAPPLPFRAGDYAAAAAERRPCLATLYLDAGWFDNGRVELAATALALAALVGPDGRLDRPREAPAHAPRSPAFRLTPERMGVVMAMVKKKVDAAVHRVAGAHFRVYPPAQFLADPHALRRPGVFDRLNGTAWLVRWHDGRDDRLSFGEFLGFVQQVVEVGTALDDDTPGGATAAARGTINGAQWAKTGPGGRPLRVKAQLDPRELAQDHTIRRLFDAVTFETV